MIPDWACALILILPAGWLRLVGHELSHAVACVVTGGTVDWARLRLWPGRIDGRWYWGWCYRDGGDDLWIGIAPAGKATALTVCWLVPAALWWDPLYVLAAWELTDIAWWWVGWFRRPESDGGRVRELLASPSGRLVDSEDDDDG